MTMRGEWVDKGRPLLVLGDAFQEGGIEVHVAAAEAVEVDGDAFLTFDFGEDELLIHPISLGHTHPVALHQSALCESDTLEGLLTHHHKGAHLVVGNNELLADNLSVLLHLWGTVGDGADEHGNSREEFKSLGFGAAEEDIAVEQKHIDPFLAVAPLMLFFLDGDEGFETLLGYFFGYALFLTGFYATNKPFEFFLGHI